MQQRFQTMLLLRSAFTRTLLPAVPLLHSPFFCNFQLTSPSIPGFVKPPLLPQNIGRSLDCLRLNNPIGLNTTYVSTFDNHIADHISRLRRVDFERRYSLSCLLQKFPILTSCQRFLPSHELFSSLIQGLLAGASPDINRIRILGRISVDEHII